MTNFQMTSLVLRVLHGQTVKQSMRQYSVRSFLVSIKFSFRVVHSLLLKAELLMKYLLNEWCSMT